MFCTEYMGIIQQSGIQPVVIWVTPQCETLVESFLKRSVSELI